MEAKKRALEEEKRRRELLEKRLQEETGQRQKLIEKEVKIKEKQRSPGGSVNLDGLEVGCPLVVIFRRRSCCV